MPTLHATPWSIREADYPAGGTPAEKLEFLLGYAVLAPSSHNTQPWRFRVAGDTVEVYADRTRALPVVDPRDRALAISCGAALFFLRLAVRRFGHVDQVALLPSLDDPDLLATVRVGDAEEPSAEVLKLFDAIRQRHTHRLRFEDAPVPPAVAEALADAAADEEAWLHRVEDRAQRSQVADLARQGDKVQFADPDFRRELARWIRPNASLAHDGMPGSAFGIPDVVSTLGPAIRGSVNLGTIWGGRSHQAVENAPLLGVLGTPGDDPGDWLAAGQALARTLLRARAEGLSASFLNQPCEVPLLRLRLREVLATEGWPQMLLRIGYPHGETPATPRRPVEEVLER